ncbi:MAG: hypothetical protein AAFR39_08665 [Pseudomonadota bacterium]
MIRIIGTLLMLAGLAMGVCAAVLLTMPDALAGFGLPALTDSQSYATVAAAGVVVVIGALMAKRKTVAHQPADLSTSNSLRLATRAVEDARAKQALEKTRPQANGREKAQSNTVPTAPSHFGQAPMRRDNNVVPDVEEVQVSNPQLTALEKSSVPPTPFDFEEDIYFEPYANLESGRVAYYQVCLRQKAAGDDNASYVKSVDGSDNETSANFDRNLIERTIAASRQVFSTLGDECYLLVPCGESLLQNDEHWLALEKLFAAQKSLLSGLIFLADDTTFNHTQSKSFDRLTQLHQQGATIACRGLNLNIERNDLELLQDLECVVSSFEDAFRAASTPDLAEPAAIEAFQFIQREKIMLLINNIVSEGDAADAIDLMAKHGSGPYFGPPRKLREAA